MNEPAHGQQGILIGAILRLLKYPDKPEKVTRFQVAIFVVIKEPLKCLDQKKWIFLSQSVIENKGSSGSRTGEIGPYSSTAGQS